MDRDNAITEDFGRAAAGRGLFVGALLASRWRRLRRLQQYARGKVISPAFADACNNLVRSLRNYRAQSVDGGLGKGGRLKVGQ